MKADVSNRPRRRDETLRWSRGPVASVAEGTHQHVIVILSFIDSLNDKAASEFNES